MDSDNLGFQYGTITLDEPNAVYYSGQTIKGNVNFKIHNSLSFLSLNVICKGEANVQWTEQEVEIYSGVRRTRDVNYVGHEEYFNISQCLVGGNDVSMLQPGTHSFPFQCQIPFNCPSSFNGDKGEVTYKVKAYLVHQSGTEEEIVKEIEVIAPLDLNTEETKRPIELEFEEVYSCNLACAARPLRLSVRAPHAGACPGERVPLVVRALNAASVEVSQIHFQIVRRMRYLSQQPMSAVVPPEEIIASFVKGPILSKTDREYNFEFVIPSFIALNLDNCGIIDVGYYFKAIVSVSGCNDDLCEEAEICMGLVPVDSNLDVKETHPMADRLPNAPIPKPNINQSYNETFAAPNMQNLYPPGPAPNYPYPNNGSKHGSKSNLAGSFEYFESNISSPGNQNLSIRMSSFKQTTIPLGFTQFQSPSPSVPQSPPPPYSMQRVSPTPSAPPATPS
ncbi:unnamed protein product [Euphydryas editha]|uniref:Arrestin C-terminal-like domain-containing protein n=1 Tax=Euphydryas editha TaxID=104508 RepID=A0AAU9TP16_EUPED|nr:unnamed protein product [Euphydryas editha]